MLQNLSVDPEFQSKIPPLREEELKQLEENILADGGYQPADRLERHHRGWSQPLPHPSAASGDSVHYL